MQNVAASYGVGAVGSLVYLRLLNRSVDGIGGFSVASAASQPRLLIPLILTLAYNRYVACLCCAVMPRVRRQHGKCGGGHWSPYFAFGIKALKSSAALVALGCLQSDGSHGCSCSHPDVVTQKHSLLGCSWR